MAETETTKCPVCGFENGIDAKVCGKKFPGALFKHSCNAHLKTDLESLRSIDLSLGAIKSILTWWLVLSILGAAFYVLSHL